MSGKLSIKKEIPLSGTKSGVITVGELQEPYGKDTEAVVTVAVALNGENVDWKIHIPYQNLDDVISALQDMSSSAKSDN